ncbi:hypothetical protein SUGI_0687780 [Cryptomeria japonica]|nr:hypothetical protein SUGI_0687780 [Cryptomeria japonica]
MYFSNNKLTKRSDVYSFEVVLLEIICGRKPIQDGVSEEEEVNLVRWVMLHAEANEDIPSRLTNIIDNRFSLGENEMQCFNCVVNLALQCVDREGSKRLTMNEIVAGIRVAMLYIKPQDIILKNLWMPCQQRDIIQLIVAVAFVMLADDINSHLNHS